MDTRRRTIIVGTDPSSRDDPRDRGTTRTDGKSDRDEDRTPDPQIFRWWDQDTRFVYDIPQITHGDRSHPLLRGVFLFVSRKRGRNQNILRDDGTDRDTTGQDGEASGKNKSSYEKKRQIKMIRRCHGSIGRMKVSRVMESFYDTTDRILSETRCI